MSFARVLLATLIFGGLSFRAQAAEGKQRGHFPFEQAGRHLRIWFFQPAQAKSDAPVLIVIHGVGRNAEDYLNDWTEYAEKKNCLLLAPEFSKEQFPSEEAFNSGNLFDVAGHPVPREQWSFSMIEPVFDAARSRFGNHSTGYLLYGHSAGAQFVQRFLYFVPDARVVRAVAANAGWYMLPEFGVAFPYGLKGTVATEAALRTAFARPVVVLLGEADTDEHHQSLRHTPGSDAQGLYRLARGQYFFSHAKAAAAAMATPFRWTLVTVPGVAHVNKNMAPFAVPQLFPE